MPLLAPDFESSASAIPPLRQQEWDNIIHLWLFSTDFFLFFAHEHDRAFQNTEQQQPLSTVILADAIGYILRDFVELLL